MENIYVMGIDIGTTSISAAVIDVKSSSQLEFFTVPNDSGIACAEPSFSEQSVDGICQNALGIFEKVAGKYHISAIGITGQMHGILYIDAAGNAVSDLINWQDGRAGLMYDGNHTCCEHIEAISGAPIYPGYGLASHFYNVINGLVPESAAGLCSIMDYVAMKLTGCAMPVMHASVAASLGLFDAQNCRFMTEAVEKLGMDASVLPAVTDEYAICGYARGIPVAVGIGDNQASFLGSVRDTDRSVLVNIGTGSQISAVTDDLTASGGVEIRPLTKGRSIACASALCGGYSYAMLEKFFRGFMAAAGHGEGPVYDTLNALAAQAYEQCLDCPVADTSFRGSRVSPGATGAITGITDANFTPGRLALGFIEGMCRELYDQFKDRLTGKTCVVASGNAVQKIPVMKNVISDMFGLPVYTAAGREEASVGAAIFAATAAGHLQKNGAPDSIIKYTED